MAWFKDLDIDELEDAPESVKKTLKEAADEARSQQAMIDKLTADVEALKPKQNPPPASENNLTEAQMATQFALQTRADAIINEMENDCLIRKTSSRYKYFIALKDEIVATLQSGPLQLRADKAYVINVYDMIVGRNMTQIKEDESKKEGKFFLESVSPAPPSIPTPKTGVDNLTPEEILYCEKNRINKETYAKSKEYHKPVIAQAV